LDTYDTERRPVGMRNVDWAMFTALNHGVLDAGMGFSPIQTLAERRANFEAFFADTPMGATRRARAAEVFATQRTEFQAHDLELGFSYAAGALLPDGSKAAPHDPLGSHYVATTRPGHRLPHAWLVRRDRTLSTLDLCGKGERFVLITGPGGHAWHAAARAEFERCGVALAIACIDRSDCLDRDGRWREVCGIGDAGAVLVRPDQHVAWRHAGAAADPRAEMARVVATVLAR
ncbi:MAG: aromatic ring hydroxylase, partial [Gammaproteobacteria bacterium]